MTSLALWEEEEEEEEEEEGRWQSMKYCLNGGLKRKHKSHHMMCMGMYNETHNGVPVGQRL